MTISRGGEAADEEVAGDEDASEAVQQRIFGEVSALVTEGDEMAAAAAEAEDSRPTKRLRLGINLDPMAPLRDEVRVALLLLPSPAGVVLWAPE